MYRFLCEFYLLEILYGKNIAIAIASNKVRNCFRGLLMNERTHSLMKVLRGSTGVLPLFPIRIWSV